MSLRPSKKHASCNGKGCNECGHRGWMFPERKPRKAMKKTQKRIKPRSDKMTKKMKVYNVKRIEFLTDNPLCQCVIAGKRLPCCQGEATDIHHKKGRLGEMLTDSDYWMALCRPCHDAIHHDAEWAYDNGFLISKNRL